MKRILSGFLCILMVLSLLPIAALADNGEPETGSDSERGATTILVSAITLSGESALTFGGPGVQLTALVTPAAATDKELTWTSDTETVAMVSSAGFVTPVSIGTAVIKATAKDGSNVFGEFPVTVTEAAPAPQNVFPNLTVSFGGSNWVAAKAQYELTFETGADGMGLPVTPSVSEEVSPVNYAYQWQYDTAPGAEDPSWTSFNIEEVPTSQASALIFSAEQGTSAYLRDGARYRCAVTASAEGYAPTTAYAVYELKLAEPQPVQSSGSGTALPALTIFSGASGFSVKSGEELPLYTRVTPGNAASPKVRWSTDNDSIATVSTQSSPGGATNDMCTVTGAGLGDALITATLHDGDDDAALATHSVTVSVVERVPVTRLDAIGINASETLALCAGVDEEVCFEVQPINADDKSLTWISSNTDVVTVTPSEEVIGIAKLHGVTTGTATVTVSSVSDPSVSYSIAVTVVANATAQLQARLNAATADNRFVHIDRAIVLTEDLTVPADTVLSFLEDSASLTVPSGITLTNNGQIHVNRNCTLEVAGTLANNRLISVNILGTLAVAGTLANNGQISVGKNAALNVTGSLTQSADLDAGIEQQHGGSISGVDGSNIRYIASLTAADGEAALREALSHTDYRGVDVQIYGQTPFSVAADLTIPANAVLHLCSTLELSSGITLTNRGTLRLFGATPGGRLLMPEGSALVNYDYIHITDSSARLEADDLTNFGHIDIMSNAALQCSGTYIKSDATHFGGRIELYSGTHSGIPKSDVTAHSTVEGSALEAALTPRGYGGESITLESNHTFTQDATIGATCLLNVGNPGTNSIAELRVPAGKTLRLNGTLFITPAGKLVVEEGGRVLLGAGSILNYGDDESRIENNGVIDSGINLGFYNAYSDLNDTFVLNGSFIKTNSGIGQMVDDITIPVPLPCLYTLSCDLGPSVENRYQAIDTAKAAELGIESVSFSASGSEYISFESGWDNDEDYPQEIHEDYPYVFFLAFTPSNPGREELFSTTVTARVTFTEESGKEPVDIIVEYGYDCRKSETITVTNAMLAADYGGSLQTFLDSDAVSNDSVHPMNVDLSGETYEVADLRIGKQLNLKNGTIQGNLLLEPLEDGTRQNLWLWDVDVIGDGAEDSIGVKVTDDVSFQLYDNASIQNFGIGLDLRGATNWCYTHFSNARIANCGVAVYQKTWTGKMLNTVFEGNDTVFKFSGTGNAYATLNNDHIPRRCSFIDNGVIVDPDGNSGHNYDLRYNYIQLGSTGAITNDSALAAVSHSIPYYANAAMDLLSIEGGATQVSDRQAVFEIDPDYLAPVSSNSIEDVLGDENVDTLVLDVGDTAQWSFGADAAVSGPVPDAIDLAVSDEITPDVLDVINDSNLPDTLQVLDFSHEGNLPYEAEVTVPTSFPAGTYSLYQVVEDALVPADHPTAVSDGSGLTVTLDHCSTYVAVANPTGISSYAQLMAALTAGDLQLRVEKAFTLGGDVVIPDGIALYLSAQLSTGARTLTIAEGGTLCVETDGALAISGSRGKLVNNGYFQMAGGALTCVSGGAFDNTDFGYAEFYGGTATFSAGAKLTNRGSIYQSAGTVTFAARSTFEDLANYFVCGTGKLVIDGNHIVPEDPDLGIDGRSDAEISGSSILPGQVINYLDLAPGEGGDVLHSLLREAAASEWDRGIVSVAEGSVTATCDLTIPAGYALSIASGFNGGYTLNLGGHTLIANGDISISSGSTLEISSGSQLDIYGTMNNGGSLHAANEGRVINHSWNSLYLAPSCNAVFESGSYLKNSGLMHVISDDMDSASFTGTGATIENDGTIYVDEGCRVEGVDKSRLTLIAHVDTLAQLIPHLALDGYAAKEIYLQGDVTLSDNAALEASVWLHLMNDNAPGHLTVAAGKTLTVAGSLSVQGESRLTIEEGALVKSVAPAGQFYIDDGRQDGAGTLRRFDDITDLDTLIAALEASAEQLDIYTDLVLSSEAPATLTVQGDCSLSISGSLTLGRNVTLKVAENASLYIPGTLIIQDGGSLVNNGDIEAELGSIRGEYTGSGTTVYYKSFTGGTLTNAAVANAAAAGASRIEIFGDVRTSGSVTIPDSVDLDIMEALRISRGTTFTCGSNVCVYGTLEFIAGSKIVGGPIVVDEYGELITNGMVVPHIKRGVKVRQILLDIGADVEGEQTIAYSAETPVYVTIQPENAENRFVTLHSDVYDSRDSSWWGIDEDGSYWLRVEPDDFTGDTFSVWAESDNDGVTSDPVTLHCVDYHIAVTQAQDLTALAAGKTLPLTGTFIPSNLTNTRLVWSLEYDPELNGDWTDCPADIAVINASTGVVTARSVFEAYALRATASAADGAAIEGSYEFTLKPLAVSVDIVDGDENSLVGTTQMIDLNTSVTTLQVYARLLPGDAGQDVTWKSSNPRVADVDENGLISGLAIYRSPVTITATANDGSRKYASFMVLVTKLAKEGTLALSQVSGDDASTDWDILAGSAMKVQAEFTSDVPTNTKLLWSVSGDAAAAIKLTQANSALGGICTVTALKSPLFADPATFVLTARTTDGSGVEVSKEIRLLPLTTNVDLIGGIGTDPDMSLIAAGATVYYDLNNKANWIDPNDETAGYKPFCVEAHSPQGKADITEYSVSTSDTRSVYATHSGQTAVQNVKWTTTPTGKVGKATLTFAATDGSGVRSVFTLMFSRLAQKLEILDAANNVVTNVAFQLLSGKSAAFKADIAADRTLTDKTVLWSIARQDGGDASAYAAISSAGRISTKRVTEQISLMVSAAVKANPVVSESFELILLPAVQTVSIKDLTHDAVLSPGETIRIDLPDLEAQRAGSYALPTLSLEGSAYPADASQSVAWTASGPVTVDQNGLVTVKWNARGNCCMTGTATVTCKAADGSGKSVSCKIAVGIPVSAITLSGASEGQVLRSGKYVQLKAVTTPDKPTIAGVTWSIDPADAAYATVSSSGRVAAKTVYEDHPVTVTATAKDGSGVSDSIQLVISPAQEAYLLLVEKAEPTNCITKQILGMNASDTFEMDVFYVVSGSEKYANNVTADANTVFTSSSRTVATVEGGVITALKNGASTVTVKYTTDEGDVLSATVTAKVTTLVSEITVSARGFASDPMLASGRTLQMQAAVAPAGASRSVTWTLDSGDEKYARINASGVLVANKGLTERQTVTVIAAAKDGSGTSGTCDVVLMPLVTGVDLCADGDHTAADDGIALQDGEQLTSRTLTVDLARSSSGTLKLKAPVYPFSSTPDECACQDVVWTSSSPRLASFADKTDGTLTLNMSGTVTIKATAADGSGRSASFKLVIAKKPTSIDFEATQDDAGNFAVCGGKRLAIKPVFEDGVTNKGLFWSIPNGVDRAFASVSSSGVVTAKNVGQQKIIHLYVESKADPALFYDLSVCIYPAVTGLAIQLLDPSEPEPITGQTLELDLGSTDSIELGAVCAPSSALQGVTWTSTSPRVASFSDKADGTLTLNTAGTVTIKATAADGSGRSASFRLVTVKNPTSIDFEGPQDDDDNFAVCGGQRLTIKPVFEDGVTNKGLSWSIPDVADRAFASVSSGGVVTAKNVGQQEIIEVLVVSKADPTLSYDLPVCIYPVTTGVTIRLLDPVEAPEPITGQTLEFGLGSTDSIELDALCTPSSAFQGVTWTSSNPRVASFLDKTDGTLTPNLPGTVTISATAADGSGRSARVTFKLVYRVESFSLSVPDNTELQVGRRLAVKVLDILPANATNKAVTWSIDPDDQAYATVSTSGVVTAKRVTDPQDVTLHCAAKDGGSANASVVLRIVPAS